MSKPPPKKAAPRKAAKADVDAVAFGRKLRAAREASGMSQADLAKAVGMPQPRFPALERGDTDVRLSTVRRFAKALGVKLKDLLPD